MVLSVLCIAVIAYGQASNLEISIAVRLRSATNAVIVNKIPEVRLVQLPKELPVFRYSGKPREFPLAGIQMLSGQSVLRETIKPDLLRSNAHMRLTSRDTLDKFAINPAKASISLFNAQRKGTIPVDTIPSFEILQNQVLKMAEMLGISTNEMQRTTNGNIFMSTGDEKTTRWNAIGPTTFVSSRRVAIPRGIEGFSTWLFNDKIEAVYGADGQLQRFNLVWPVIEPVRTNKVLKIQEIITRIRKGETLTDVTEYAEGGLTEIRLKDFEIQYYFSESSSLIRATPTNADIYPIIAVLAAFKSGSEEIEGGIYLPTSE